MGPQLRQTPTQPTSAENKLTEPVIILNIVSKAYFPLSAILLVLASCSGLAWAERGHKNLFIGSERAGEATLIRDDWGVPHIYADTEPAGYHALGYAQAEDRGEFVLFVALMGMGKAASVEGPSMLASDMEARRWRHAEESQAGFAALSPHIQANYRALAAGFNRYYADHPGKAPEWQFDLEPWHLVAISRNLLWDVYMVGDGLEDCRRGGATLAQGDAEPMQRRAGSASNVWVLHPERTADGAMMFMNDPHGDVEQGAGFYEYRLHAGDLHSAGYSLGGTLFHAHTRSLTWGMTTGSPDVSDCYAVETDPENPLRYRFDGMWKEMTTRDVAIEVMNGQTQLQTFAYTDHNGVLSPVVARSGATAYVVSSPYMHAAHTLDEEIDRLNRAKDVAEAKHAMRNLGMFAQNVMFADAAGNSWYVRAGRTPIRPEGFDWSRPVSGNVSRTAWRGLHPLDDLVQITNPPTGYMQNNNLAPDEMTLPAAPVNAEDYPAYIFNDRTGRSTVRGDRTNEVLSQAQNFTVEDAIDHALDEKWMATATWLEALAHAAEAEASSVQTWDQTHRDFLEALLLFDGHARADSAAALKYYMWRQAIYNRQIEAQILAAMSAQWTNYLGAVVSADVLLTSVGAAAALIADLFDTGDATLGDLVRIGVGEADYPVGGITLAPLTGGECLAEFCEATARAFETPPLEGPIKPFRVQFGSFALRLVVFTDPIQSFTVLNFGQSTDPESPHFDDQARLLTSERKLKPVYFERRQLEGHIKSEVTLGYEPVAR